MRTEPIGPVGHLIAEALARVLGVPVDQLRLDEAAADDTHNDSIVEVPA
jgi:hypothetical protein